MARPHPRQFQAPRTRNTKLWAIQACRRLYLERMIAVGFDFQKRGAITTISKLFAVGDQTIYRDLRYLAALPICPHCARPMPDYGSLLSTDTADLTRFYNKGAVTENGQRIHEISRQLRTGRL